MRRIKRIISRGLSIVMAFSMLLGTGAALPVEANQVEGTTYSEAGIMTVVSRRVTKPEIYGNVPENQKTVSEQNPVAVVNDVISVNLNETNVIDYVRFSGTELIPADRRVGVGSETITFTHRETEVAAVDDWTNLSITSGTSENTTTATNFRGEGAEVTFTIPTEAEQIRTFTIYAGGHPNTGTITTIAAIGGKVIKAVAGNTEDDQYSFTPNSSQITEYKVAYIGTGEELKVTLKVTGIGDKNWAGIGVAAAVLRGVEQAEEPQPNIPQAELAVVKKLVSKSSLFSNVPAEQKVVSDTNPVAVENMVMDVDLTTSDVIDYLRFTGAQSPIRKNSVTEENIQFSSRQTGVEAIYDWSNLLVSYDGANKTTTATNFKGGNATVEVTIPTLAGQKRTLDIYAGGHPNIGTYTASALLGETPVFVIAGAMLSESYTYTPASSQIVHYQINYVGTGEDLQFTLSLANTGGVNWAGIGVAAVVLRQDIATISPQKGYFNKSISDAQYRDLSTTINVKEGVTLFEVQLNGQALSEASYSYDAVSKKITLRTSYLETLSVGEQKFTFLLSNGNILDYTADISDASTTPRPYVKDSQTLFNQDLNAWKLWYQDEFETKLDDWWEPSYLKWWNYSSESNEKYNQIVQDERSGNGVLKQFTTENMRTDSIVTRRDNFRNPGITLGVKDLIHNYGAKDLMNYQHMATDDRGATAYGYFEIRAKITGGTTAKNQSGSSAWWFTGFQDVSWQTVEVDMVEYGYTVSEQNLNASFASPLHTWRDPFAKNLGKTYWSSLDNNIGVAKPADDYHIYGYEWTPSGMNGYFDGVLVWTKNTSVNYRMLMWLSLNSHAYDTYTTDAKTHYIDYVRIWKTPELEELEKQIVTKNIVQKQAPVEGNVATLAYAGANGVRSSHYRKYDPAYMNDGDSSTSYRAMTKAERAMDNFPVSPYINDDHYLYLDWVEYTEQEVAEASPQQEVITDLKGKQFTLASEQQIRSAKKIAAIELLVNKNAKTKSINAGSSDNSTGSYVYNTNSEAANYFPYEFDIEYSEDGYNGWTPLASNVKADWRFDENGVASFVTNIIPKDNVRHIRLKVNSVWNTNTNQKESTENGFYVAEIKVYEVAKEAPTASVSNNYNYNHAAYALVSVTDRNGNKGSEDTNFPIGDVADGVYINEFKSSGDGIRMVNNANRVDTTKENIPDYPQYINFKWASSRKIDNFGLTIGYMESAPLIYNLQVKQADGTWKTIVEANETWTKDFEEKNYQLITPVTASEMRVEILKANKGSKLEYNGGIEGNAQRVVRIAGGYYSIAEIELNEIK